MAYTASNALVHHAVASTLIARDIGVSWPSRPARPASLLSSHAIPAKFKGSFAIAFTGAVLGCGRCRNSRNAARRASVWQIFNNDRPEADRIDEEIAAMRLKETQDLIAFEAMLQRKGPSENDLKIEALRLQNIENAKRLQQRRERARRDRERRARNDVQVRAQSAHMLLQGASPWQSVLHPATNRFYYFNKETGVTTWTPPPALHRPLNSRPMEPPLPWRLLPDPSSGMWYYHNAVTGQTSWEPPSPVPTSPMRTLKAMQQH